ncbi:glycosyltransferase family 9 protein [Stutzerimonas chloritidismutans]|uniref:glycosyltransferase family 9 protein n=1 Tax=Stutzerimonas chloritidismutans TaxID=203192 RepID=UPI001427D589|nr:glycosyltransferase family 9 protein [Stutzerimonas chloritidismutans]
MKPKRLHVVNTHGIGDVVMTLPMLMAAHGSGFHLSMTVKSRSEAQVISCLLAPHNVHIEFVCYQDFSRKGLLGNFKLICSIRKLKPTHVVPTFSSNKFRYNMLAWASGAKNRVGLGGPLAFLNHSNVAFLEGIHKVEKNVSVLEQALSFWSLPLCLLTPLQLPVFQVSVKSQAALLSKLGVKDRPLVCLAPGSGVIEKHKRWPIENYAQLANILLKNNFQVAVVGGPGEEKLGLKIKEIVGDAEGFFDITGQLSILETLLFLNYSSCVVANCNGVSHMAAAVQTPVLGIYGPTDPALTGPFAKKFTPVTHDIQCRPCYGYGYIQGCGNPICMSSISVNQVWVALKGFL